MRLNRLLILERKDQQNGTNENITINPMLKLPIRTNKP